jgi:hypothetical protein
VEQEVRTVIRRLVARGTGHLNIIGEAIPKIRGDRKRLGESYEKSLSR